jgi:hypothetical protein
VRHGAGIHRSRVSIAPTPLPEDPATLQRLLLEAQAEIMRLQMLIAGLLRHRFGRRSEQLGDEAFGPGDRRPRTVPGRANGQDRSRRPACRSRRANVYIWLSYRLNALKKDVEVGWPALYAQFGAGFGTIRRFRQHFLECLGLAMAAYPEARIVIGERGLILMPSRSAIAKL